MKPLLTCSVHNNEKREREILIPLSLPMNKTERKKRKRNPKKEERKL